MSTNDAFLNTLLDRLPPSSDGGRVLFMRAFLSGDAQAVRALREHVPPARLERWSTEALAALTSLHKEKKLPLCQFIASAQAAAEAHAADGSAPAVCIGAAAGDPSPTGKLFVRMILSAYGISVLDLGVDVPPEAFLRAVESGGIRYVFVSAFVDCCHEAVRAIDRMARERGIRRRFKLIAGGACAEAEVLERLGADNIEADVVLIAERVSQWMNE